MSTSNTEDHPIEQSSVSHTRTQTITLSGGKHHHKHHEKNFEDVIFHPFRELEERQKKKEKKEKLKNNQGTELSEKDIENGENESSSTSEKEIVIHVKRMSGKHTFKIADKELDKLAVDLGLSPEEKEKFRSLTDTDELRRYCISTDRVVKMVFDSTINLGEKDIIALNDNIFLEINTMESEKGEEEEGHFQNTRREIFKIPDPDLSDNFDEKSASWLELFYDLFYIVALSQFTHTHHIVDGTSFLIYTGWFIILWWAWISSALYTTRFDTNDVLHHIFKLIEMFGVVGLAGSSNQYFSTDGKGFIISYIVLKSVLVLEYSLVYGFSRAEQSASARPLRYYVLVNIIAIIMWGASLSLEGVGRFALWYISILIEVLVNFWFRKNKETSVAKGHLGERVGLLTLIVLGENVIGLVKLLAEEEEILLITAELMGVTILFGFFYIYFDDFSKDVLSETQQSYVWLFLHFPLHLFQISVGIALTDLISIERIAFGKPAVPTEHSVISMHSFLEATTGESNSTSSPDLVTTGDEEPQLVPDFVSRTFLASAAFVLLINAIIKILHSRLAEKEAVIIVAFRIFIAVVFFVIIAIPFDMWGSAVALLGFMTGMMILQCGVDLLD